MTVPAIIPELHAAGFRLWQAGGRIMIEPASRLTPEHRSAIKGNRAAILAALSERETAIRAELERIMGAGHPDFVEALAVALAVPDGLETLKRTTAQEGTR